MYNLCRIELFCLTDVFYTKKKVNTMHNECIMDLVCSPVQESPMSKVKVLHNLCIIKLFCLTDPFYTKSLANAMHNACI